MRFAFITTEEELKFASEVAESHIKAFHDAGHSAEMVIFDTAAPDWTNYDAIVLLFAWGYHRDAPAFLRLLHDLEQRMPIVNPVAVVEWNLDKHYLGALRREGVPIVPTEYLQPANRVNLREKMAELGWSEAVFKPVVSAMADHTHRSFDGDAQECLDSLLLNGREMMLQPYLKSVEKGGTGEHSLMFIDGKYSHAAMRRCAFAADDEREGERMDASADELAVATRVVEVAQRLAGSSFAYARVDLVRDDSGAPVLMELEVLEPHLFIAAAPDPAAAARNLIETLARAAGCGK